MIGEACVIIDKTRCFKDDITGWNRKPESTKLSQTLKNTSVEHIEQEFRESTDVTLEDSELRNNANLVQQAANGMQAAMANEYNTDDNAEMLLPASKTQQQLNAKMQEMQQSMNPLQAQVASQQPVSYQPCNGCQSQGHQN
jgi:hypothetical protein